MSGFIGNAQPQFILRAKDERLHRESRHKQDARRRNKSRHTLGLDGYYTDFWPRLNGFLGERAVDVAMLAATGGRKTERYGVGVASRVGFPGVTVDQFGAPLGGCTVVLHRTSTRELVHEMVSDANGVYLSQSIYAGEGHYTYYHKAGAINVFGASDNNLIGA